MISEKLLFFLVAGTFLFIVLYEQKNTLFYKIKRLYLGASLAYIVMLLADLFNYYIRDRGKVFRGEPGNYIDFFAYITPLIVIVAHYIYVFHFKKSDQAKE